MVDDDLTEVQGKQVPAALEKLALDVQLPCA